jgi:hypothetical protein
MVKSWTGFRFFLPFVQQFPPPSRYRPILSTDHRRRKWEGLKKRTVNLWITKKAESKVPNKTAQLKTRINTWNEAKISAQTQAPQKKMVNIAFLRVWFVCVLSGFQISILIYEYNLSDTDQYVSFFGGGWLTQKDFHFLLKKVFKECLSKFNIFLDWKNY